MPPNVEPLIEKLIAKSEAGSVPWKPTAEEDTFIVSIEGELSFEVSKLEDGGFAFTMKDTEGRNIIDMTCHNTELWDPQRGRDDGYFNRIERLFEAARATALEVDKKLNVAENLLDKF
jgi:hypothetical protein